MRIRVVTLMWGDAWERYGEAFCLSFNKFWPGNVELVVVTDRNLPMLRGRQIAMETVPGMAAFSARYAGDTRAAGYGHKGKVDHKGYSWRHDAIKWAPQGMAPLAAANDLDDGDFLIWLDADVETIAKVPADWVETLMKDADVACLQRQGTHSEIGFIGFRMGPMTRRVLRAFAGYYTSGEVFHLKEWHSAYVFDRSLEVAPLVRIRNLNTGRLGHVFETSPLKDHLIHKKGKRKDK